jgi:hypothetical protein
VRFDVILHTSTTEKAMNEQSNNVEIIWKCTADERLELVKLLAWPEERKEIEKVEQQQKQVESWLGI